MQQVHLSAQQQAAHHALFGHYSHHYGTAEAAMVANIAARNSHSNSMYRHDFSMLSGGMFPATSAGAVSHPPHHAAGRAAPPHMDSHAQQVASAQAAAFYPNQQHSGGHPSSLVSLQQLTQRLDLLPPMPAQHPPTAVVTTKSPPPPPRQTKAASSKSSSSASSSSKQAANLQHPAGILTGYPGYPHGAGAANGQRGGAAGQRPPNVTINPSLMQYNAMQQYNAYNAMLNPALVNQMYQGHYDPQRGAAGTQMYGYSPTPYINYHR